MNRVEDLNYDKYLLSNMLFLNRTYSVTHSISVQLIQKQPRVYLIYSEDKKLLIDEISKMVLERIEAGDSLEAILNKAGERYTRESQKRLILIIMKSIRKLSNHDFINRMI